MDVVAECGEPLESEGYGEHLEDSVHGAALTQRMPQRLHVDTGRQEVGEDQQEVETVKACNMRERWEICSS